MALLKISCPECNAKLKSATGFKPGATVSCPKCETDFTVREPDDELDDEPPKKATTATKGKETDPAGKKSGRDSARDDDRDEDDEKPTKKKKKKRIDDDDDEPGRSYKNSPMRFAVLGVLVVTMLVLGYFLYKKWKDEREVADANNAAGGDPAPAPNPGRPPTNPDGTPIGKFPDGKFPGGMFPGGKGPDGMVPGGKGPGGKFPVGKGPGGKGPNPGQPGGNPVPGNPVGGGDPLAGLFGGGPAVPGGDPALMQKFTTALVGTWVADLGGGDTEELTYTAAGTYTAKLTGSAPAMVSGKYTVQQVVGSTGLRLRLDDGTSVRTITVTFEGAELEHPSLQKGMTGTFRKK